MNTTQTNVDKAAHTPAPWTTGLSTTRRYVTNSSGSVGVCSVLCDDEATGIANAAHIVRCVNAHDALVEALKAYRKEYTIREDDKQNPHMQSWIDIETKADAALALANVD